MVKYEENSNSLVFNVEYENNGDDSYHSLRYEINQTTFAKNSFITGTKIVCPNVAYSLQGVSTGTKSGQTTIKFFQATDKDEKIIDATDDSYIKIVSTPEEEQNEPVESEYCYYKDICGGAFLSINDDNKLQITLPNYKGTVIGPGNEDPSAYAPVGGNEDLGDDEYLAKIREYISKMEGTNTDVYDCKSTDGQDGVKVEWDPYSLNEGNWIRTTTYGITHYALGPLNSCERISENDRNKYFADENFVVGLCIPKSIIKTAMLCYYDSVINSIQGNINNYCEKEVNFNQHQMAALVDEANSGLGHSENVIKDFCTKYNSSNDLTSAYNAMFESIFSAEKMNPLCIYIARRDCEARLFFEGDYTCANQSPYASDYQFKYYQYFDNKYYTYANGKCHGSAG